ncbi:hypothetical protein [Thermococcus sp. AM4]|uniref:hypothetical protein n=1 Tax=Thermococcus sp. (strain AM4) TaxID=246969 RepID=UPI00018707C9|nr:hypothetical protein [Thermococcus sp. AM4]EEB74165.1 conserved hypothetical protein [Thermococcus sp. AM4]
MRRLLAVIVALLILSAFLGYTYHRVDAEVKNAESGLLSVSITALSCMSDMDAFKTMLETNTSADLLRERAGRYAYCAQVLSEASESLYELTGKETYRDIHAAASNLAVFFNHVRNSGEPKELLLKNVDVIVSIGDAISEVYKAELRGGLRKNQTGRLLNLTKGLSW